MLPALFRALNRSAASACRVASPFEVRAYAIGDLLRPETPGEGVVVAATLDLYFSLNIESGNWSIAEMQSWQKATGLTPLKTLAALSMPGWKWSLLQSVSVTRPNSGPPRSRQPRGKSLPCASLPRYSLSEQP